MSQIRDPRAVLAVTGEGRVEFLQNIVSNDVTRAGAGPVYAALLTPQGKYLADFFMIARDDAILIDVAEPMAEGLFRRLSMYKLRAAIAIEATGLGVRRVIGDTPGALPDPRHPDLPHRLYGDERDDSDPTDIRVRHVIPQSGIELIPDDSYLLEAGFERLHGVDFRKGCYVGQEVTARMKHKTELRKGLARVGVAGTVPVGTPIETSDGKPAGTLFSQSGGQGIAYLRFDRAQGEMSAGDARVTWDQARSE